jgi:hypothetical protein
MNKPLEKENAEVEGRWQEFWRDHEDYDYSWARSVLHDLTEWLPYVFRFEAIAHGLKELSERSGVPFELEEWTDAFEHMPASALSQLPICKLALALRAYAYYGLLLSTDQVHVLEFLEMVEVHVVPLEWGNDDDMRQTITAALARCKLDSRNASEGLTFEELAALAKVSRKSLMNLAAPGKHGVLQKTTNNKITFESAARWLSTRTDFRRSIWQQQEKKTHAQPALPSALIEPLFVPIASDGSWFSPADHQRDGRYYVANGDTEERFDDYWQALEFTSKASAPRWRYLDTGGRLRMRAMVRWERKARLEVEELAAATRSTLTEGAKP